MRVCDSEKRCITSNYQGNKMKKDLNMKIGIVGAGAAGLTAADALKTKGYKNISILEREAVAGGKCCSIYYKGRPYELGAGVISGNCDTILNLAKKFGINLYPIPFNEELIFVDVKTGKHIYKKRTLAEALFSFNELFFKYKRLTRRYKKMEESGLMDVDTDLCIPFSKFAIKHKIPFITKEFAAFFTGFGYGYFDEIPAAYVLKYYTWDTVRSFFKKKFFSFPDGIQKLWLAVADDHNIIYNVHIEKIKRDRQITVKTKEGELQFDVLILTSPLDEALNYLDASVEEKKLFSKIVYCDYRTYAVFVKVFPKRDGYLTGYYRGDHKGQPVFWHSWYKDSDLYTFYVLGDWKIPDEQVLKNIENIIRNLGGTLGKVHVIKHWKYFPHVDVKEMKNGYFNVLEGLQGKNSTYYAGELLNFSTVELSAAYANKLIERFF